MTFLHAIFAAAENLAPSSSSSFPSPQPSIIQRELRSNQTNRDFGRERTRTRPQCLCRDIGLQLVGRFICIEQYSDHIDGTRTSFTAFGTYLFLHSSQWSFLVFHSRVCMLHERVAYRLQPALQGYKHTQLYMAVTHEALAGHSCHLRLIPVRVLGVNSIELLKILVNIFVEILVQQDYPVLKSQQKY